MRWLKLSTLFFLIVLAPLIGLCEDVEAQSVSSPGSMNVTDSTIYNLISSSGTVVSVAGLDPVKVVISATAGTLKITTTAGLAAPTGYTTAEWAGSGEIGFSGSLSDVNNALATLQFLGTGTITVSPTSPTVVYSSVTGNFYEKSTTDKNFAAAKADAESRSINGASGYLATVTSTAEFDYIKSKAGLSTGIWLGASDNPVEGEWRWVGGPENGQQFWQGGAGGSVVDGMWSDWNPGEPNNSSNEDYLQITTGGKLNDLNGTGLLSYVIEYTGTSVNTSASFSVVDTPPTMAITAAEVSDDGSSGDSGLSMTFTANEATADFTVGDITVTNGTISNFVAVSSTVYTATFTPTATGATTIDVAAGTFADAAGNNNTAAAQFNWTYSLDPTLKADVVAGLLSKELIAYQFYKGSIQSVNDRLAWLASRRGNPNKSKQGIKFNFGDPLLNQLLTS